LRRLRGLDNFVGLMDTSLIMTEEGWKVSTEAGQAYVGALSTRVAGRPRDPQNLTACTLWVHDRSALLGAARRCSAPLGAARRCSALLGTKALIVRRH
jgi:hypothetical protein